WSTTANWSGGIVPSDSTSSATFGSAISGARTVTLDSARTVGAITVNNSNSYTIAGSNVLTLNSSTGTAQLLVSAGNHSITAPIAVSQNTAVMVTSSGSTLTLSGAMTFGTGTAFTKAGAGTV